MVSVYSKNYSDLSDLEKQQVELAYNILARGDRLYGETTDDTSHIGWALGHIITRLQQVRKAGSSGSMYLEISLDSDGYAISLVN